MSKTNFNVKNTFQYYPKTYSPQVPCAQEWLPSGSKNSNFGSLTPWLIGESNSMFCSSCGGGLEENFNSCPQCGEQTAFSSTACETNVESEKEVIESYFYAGYEYETILAFLNKHHGISMSMSTLKRRLNNYQLKRRNAEEVNIEDVKYIIRKELDGPSCISGYRTLWHILLIKYETCVPRDRVQELLKELDPAGIEERKRHKLKRRKYKSPCPNQCWHVDGYDKLKSSGFPVHGAIDGYSRPVLWLKITRTNNNPAVIAKYHHDCIVDLGDCPRMLATDPGNENVEIANMQCFLRSSGTDDLAGDKARHGGSIIYQIQVPLYILNMIS